MKIIEKMAGKSRDNWGQRGVVIGFLGDSVTQGCFELYLKNDGGIETYFDQNFAYHRCVARILSMLYPSVPVNIVNAGISGGSASHGLERISKDLIDFHPDLAVVCFGLNDAMGGWDGLEGYKKALGEIFNRLMEAKIEIIFMTPNMMNTEISCHLEKEVYRELAMATRRIQTEGIMDAYMEAAISVCKAHGVKICDCYGKWKKLATGGVNTTELLANQINHPTREMNSLFAVSLVETMFEN